MRIPAGQPAEKHSGKVRVVQMNTRVTMKKVRSSLKVNQKLTCIKGTTRLIIKLQNRLGVKADASELLILDS